MHDIDAILNPILKVLIDVAERVSPPKWTGTIKLGPPLDHIATQPEQKIKKILENLDNQEEHFRIVLEMAFQYGVCQGYEMAKKEEADNTAVRETLRALKQC